MKKEFKATVYVTVEDEKFIDNVLSIKEGRYEGDRNIDEDILFIRTVEFPNGYTVDVVLCNGNSPFVDVVLFNSNGERVAEDEISDVFLRESRFEVDNMEFVVNRKVFPEFICDPDKTIDNPFWND